MVLALLIVSPLSSCPTSRYLFIIGWSCFILREARGSLLDMGWRGKGGGGGGNKWSAGWGSAGDLYLGVFGWF